MVAGTMYAMNQYILHGMYSTSTIVLLLSVCTGCTGNVLAVSVYYYSSKNVYSIVYIILRLHSEYKTVLRFIDGTEYSTTWSSESQYGKWYCIIFPTPDLDHSANIRVCRPGAAIFDTFQSIQRNDKYVWLRNSLIRYNSNFRS